MSTYLPPISGAPGELPTCWICLSNEPAETLIRPCPCAELVHRGCLDQWRFSATNPSMHLSCPNCRFAYRFVAKADLDLISKAKSLYRRQIITALSVFWTVVLVVVTMLTVGYSALALLFDRSRFLVAFVRLAFISSLGLECPSLHTRTPVFTFENGTAVPAHDNDMSISECLRALIEISKAPGTRIWPFYAILGLVAASFTFAILAFVFKHRFSPESMRANVESARDSPVVPFMPRDLPPPLTDSPAAGLGAPPPPGACAPAPYGEAAYAQPYAGAATLPAYAAGSEPGAYAAVAAGAAAGYSGPPPVHVGRVPPSRARPYYGGGYVNDWICCWLCWPSPPSHHYGGSCCNTAVCCADACGDCDCNCGNCGDCGDCNCNGNNDCKCGEGVLVVLLVAVVIVVILILLAAIAALIYVVVSGVIASAQLANAYKRRVMDEAEAHAGAVEVADLSHPLDATPFSAPPPPATPGAHIVTLPVSAPDAAGGGNASRSRLLGSFRVAGGGPSGHPLVSSPPIGIAGPPVVKGVKEIM